MNIKVGDVVFYKGSPVTVVLVDNSSYHLKWFVETTLMEATASRGELSLLKEEPSYLDYIRYLEKKEILESIGSSDDLEEFLLNEAVYSLKDSFQKYNIPQDDIVDAVYNVIRKRSDAFKYLSDCYFAEGYSTAVYEVAGIDLETGKEMMKNVISTRDSKE